MISASKYVKIKSVVFPEWKDNREHETKYRSDIALVELASAINLKSYLIPACLTPSGFVPEYKGNLTVSVELLVHNDPDSHPAFRRERPSFSDLNFQSAVEHCISFPYRTTGTGFLAPGGMRCNALEHCSSQPALKKLTDNEPKTSSS